jgi:hypothetical protein
MLSEEPYAVVFGPASPGRYLSRTLERRGTLLVRYYAIAHQALPNEIALLSGQGPTDATAADCPVYSEIAPGPPLAEQQASGQGCVYPAATATLPSQLAAKHLDWRAYIEGTAEGAGTLSACGHPSLGQSDPPAAPPQAAKIYADFRNPFIYFRSLTDSPACNRDVFGLNRLFADLHSGRRAPRFAYIAPDRCHDGNPSPCAPGAAEGVGASEGFLRRVVPAILLSKAYRDGGLIVITVDEAPASGELADSSFCCAQPRFPGLDPSQPAGARSGGGQVGALLISPFVKPGTTSQEPYNHFSLLRTIEDLFGLRHLGYAALPKVGALGAAAFDASLQR